MAYPEYIPTRVVSVGGATALESSALLKIQVAIVASRSLIWDATGYRFEKAGHSVESELGNEVQIILPRTDVAGWKDAATGSIIDVSAEDAYSHRYTATVRFLDANNSVVGAEYTIGPFPIPDGEGAIDLDRMVPASTVAGDAISIPDLWSQLVSQAEAAATSAQAALVDSAQFVADEIGTPGTPARINLEATYGELAHAARFPVSTRSVDPAALLEDAGMTAGSAVLSTSHTFTAHDVGKVIGVRGAGPVSNDYTVLANDGVLVSTIQNVSGGVATLADPAVTTCTDCNAVFGEALDDALDAADAAAATFGGGVIELPAGRWITTRRWEVTPGNSIVGAGRDLTVVHYVHVGPGSGHPDANWIKTTGGAGDEGANYSKSHVISDFHIDAQFFAADGPVGSNMKVIQVTNAESSTVTRMRITDNPATALGYDESRRLLIEDCIILNAGRLGPRGTGAGYSAIGITVGDLYGPASCVIQRNFIDGGWQDDADPANKNSHTGIHLEGIFVDAGDTGTDYEDSYIITENVIERCGVGIRDSGALGTIISENQISRCARGIDAAHKGGSGSRAPREAIISDNHISDGIEYPGFAAITTGIQVSTAETTRTDHGRINVHDNTVSRVAGHAVSILGDNANPLCHVRVADNILSDNDGYGVYVYRAVKHLSIVDNDFISNGRTIVGVGAGVGVHNTVSWEDGWVVGNTFVDYQDVPTQIRTVDFIGSPILVDVYVGGNSDTPPALRTDARLKAKTSTTNITSNTTMATLSAFTVPLEAGQWYEFTARLPYISSAQARIKFGLFLGAGSTAEWWITGPGAPNERYRNSDVVALDGDGEQRVAIIQGWVYADTAFNFGIQAAQETSDASTTSVSTGSRLSVRRITSI